MVCPRLQDGFLQEPRVAVKVPLLRSGDPFRSASSPGTKSELISFTIWHEAVAPVFQRKKLSNVNF